jgi:glycosyltransferase involved in cell wall biosynthesis
MRYSVLLPTRNGASLLENCVRSVLEQDYKDMELVVSNNASDDGTRELLDAFGSDPRLRVVHLEEPVNVTENWNVALAHSRGERILLIGDDDLLLQGYFERVDWLLAEHADPDVLSYNAYAFAYPGFGGSPDSHFADPFFPLDGRIPRDAPIPGELRRTIVREMFRFAFSMPLNMQTTIVARSAFSDLEGDLFVPPFPDFYAINALLLRSERWVATDERLLVVGVSPKSFGRSLHSPAEQARGVDYLGIETDFEGRLPGSEFLNGTYRCLLELRHDFPDELGALQIDRSAYVFWQVYSWYVQTRLGSLSPRQLARRSSMLQASDWLRLLQAVAVRLRPAKVARRVRIDRHDPAPQLWPGMQRLPDVRDIAEFADWLNSRPPGAHSGGLAAS